MPVRQTTLRRADPRPAGLRAAGPRPAGLRAAGPGSTGLHSPAPGQVPARGSPPSPVPAPGLARWASIAQSLRQRIVDGEWAAGQAIPAESALARDYGVALGTLRNAIDSLVAEALLERAQGKGTFVRGAMSGAGLARFFRWGTNSGNELPGSRVLSMSVDAAGAQAAHALELDPRAPALRLVRHRLRGARTVLHETIWLPLPAFEALGGLALAQLGPLLYPIYATHCGITVHRALDDLAFARLTSGVARALGVPTGHAAIRVTRRAFDLAGRPVEYRITFGNADDFRYQAEVR